MAPKFEQTEHGKKYKAPLQAVKAFCCKCINGGIKKVEGCESDECELFAYRTGKNPFSARRVMSKEQRQAASERFKKMWADGEVMGRGAEKPKAKPATKKKVIKKVVKAKKK